MERSCRFAGWDGKLQRTEMSVCHCKLSLLLQAIRKRVHGVEAQLSLQGTDGAMVLQVEDTINELHKQMGELERSFCEHQKGLDMTCRLHQAMQEVRALLHP